jgi:hypothetical protein
LQTAGRAAVNGMQSHAASLRVSMHLIKEYVRSAWHNVIRAVAVRYSCWFPTVSSFVFYTSAAHAILPFPHEYHHHLFDAGRVEKYNIYIIQTCCLIILTAVRRMMIIMLQKKKKKTTTQPGTLSYIIRTCVLQGNCTRSQQYPLYTLIRCSMLFLAFVQHRFPTIHHGEYIISITTND